MDVDVDAAHDGVMIGDLTRGCLKIFTVLKLRSMDALGNIDVE